MSQQPSKVGTCAVHAVSVLHEEIKYGLAACVEWTPAQTEPAPQVEFERETDERWICDISHHPGVMAYGHTPNEALINAVDLLQEPRLTQTAEQFWPKWHQETYGNSVEQYMPADGWKQVAYKFATAFAAHELAASQAEIKRLNHSYDCKCISAERYASELAAARTEIERLRRHLFVDHICTHKEYVRGEPGE